MCTIPNSVPEAIAAIDYAAFTNINTFLEENNPRELAETLDILFNGFLQSELSEIDGRMYTAQMFEDYLKLKHLLEILAD